MTIVIFVHGINTRGTGYDLAFGRIHAALSGADPTSSSPPAAGATIWRILKGQGQSIPRYETKGVESRDAGPADEVDLWRCSTATRWPSCASGSAARPAAGTVRPPRRSDARRSDRAAGTRGGRPRFRLVQGGLDAAGLTPAELDAARRGVNFDPAFAAATRAAGTDGVTEVIPTAWARAVVARG